MRLLFSFDAGDGINYWNVYVDDFDPTLLTATEYPYITGQPPFPTYAHGDNVGSAICQGTTLTTYKFAPVNPWAIYFVEYNSPTCGYVPPVCDLALSTLSHTDETNTEANDGTINIFGTSSSLPILYNLIGVSDNNVGYFTNVAPGTYELAMSDAMGCSVRGIFVTIQPFDTNKTRCKYRLNFASLKNSIDYRLDFLYQKTQFDPLVYPLRVTGTDSPILRKTTSSNEDKTDAFCPSSLTINLISNGVFDVKEFADAQERDWKIELYKRQVSNFTPVNVAITLTEQTSPSFIDGNVQLKINGIIQADLVSSGTYLGTLPVGTPYSIEAYTVIAPTDPNAKTRLTILRGSTVIFDKQIPTVVGQSIIKTGIVQNDTYDISVSTASTSMPVTFIDIDDNADPFWVLDWQGWLLPDELQDLYADPNYAISMIATDGLLSLKGSTFGDLSLYYLDQQGIKRLIQLFGLKKWVYLVKICLDQLGYDYGSTTIVSSLTYFPVDNNWLNYSTWADLFYDTNNAPKDTYSALEILLKGMHLQIFQHKGKFVLWDINDVYYRNNSPISLQSYCFETDLDTILTQGELPSNLPIGANQLNKPINPQQTLNYDKAFSQIEADITFTLLSLLYPNPGFEINSTQGALPQGFVKNGTIDAYLNYDPQDPLNPNVGAFSGDWELKIKDNWPGRFGYDFNNYIHLSTPIIVDQPFKKLNLSYMWRAYFPAPTFPNSLPVTIVTFTGSVTGTKWTWWIGVTNNLWQVETVEPFNHTAAPNIETTDYTAWNSFNISTDIFPEGSGTLDIRILPPSYWYPGHDLPTGTPLEVDIDNLVLTISDAQDAYNFQTGENHLVTNITSYAKSEKKNIDLSMFTFPGNKRMSGNLSYGSDYLTSKITNEWKFALSVEQSPDRLPANIIRRFAKNYQRPMYKFQGDISSDTANYYAIWILSGYESKTFIAFTIEMDLRNSTGNVVLIEIDDTQMQSFYQYVPIYSKSARNNTV